MEDFQEHEDVACWESSSFTPLRGSQAHYDIHHHTAHHRLQHCASLPAGSQAQGKKELLYKNTFLIFQHLKEGRLLPRLSVSHRTTHVCQISFPLFNVRPQDDVQGANRSGVANMLGRDFLTLLKVFCQAL